MYHRASLFCRNLGLLLGNGVNLTTTLRILVDMMSSVGPSAVWTETADRVRHGAKLSDALAETKALPQMAVRMLRLGDETGQLPVLAGRTVIDLRDPVDVESFLRVRAPVTSEPAASADELAS